MSLNKKKFQIVYAIAVTLLLALTNSLAGQDTGIHTPQFTAGIKVGMQTTSVITFPPGSGPPPVSFDHFTFGPVAEVGLPRRLGVEFDALHKHYAEGGPVFGELSHAPVLIGFADAHISYWDFPLMLKWRISSHRLLPFVAGGLALRHTDVVEHATSLPTPPLVTPLLPERLSVNTWTRGPVVSGGLEYAIGRHIRVSPEIRYTHWTEPAIGLPTGNPASVGPEFVWQANQNQLEILLGLTFGSH